MSHFGVSRPTLREAVRVLESEPWSRCAAARAPGPACGCPGPGSSPARPDCCWSYPARPSPTPDDGAFGHRADGRSAARRIGRTRLFDELGRCWPNTFRRAASRAGGERRANFIAGRRIVRQHHAGDTPGMLHEITVRHTAFAIKERRTGVQSGLRENSDALLTDACVQY